MTTLKLTEYPAKVLLQPAADVEAFGAHLERLVQDMFETMYAEEGVGLAATQVGLSLRLFVMDCEGLKLVAVNPEITGAEGEQSGEEGCLSVGRVYAPLKRASRVRLRAQGLNGKYFEEEATGLAARCFLHETDHCDGILFIDHLTPLRRDMVKKRFLKLKKIR
ncbi:MAG: peptide deformylase [Acidobacteria bacterium]|nr:peptide deformylase [Acidobacteriota bacterium]